MCVPMCFGSASFVSQKSGLDPGKLLTGHTSAWRRSGAETTRAASSRCPYPVQAAHSAGRCSGRPPERGARYEYKVYFTAGHRTGRTETRRIRDTPVFPVFSQTKRRRKQWLRTCQWRSEDFIHSCRFTPSEKSPCQRNARAGFGPRCPEGPAQHRSTSQHLGGLAPAFSFTFPQNPTGASKAKASSPGCCTSGAPTPSATKLQSTRVKSDSATSDPQHPLLLCSPPDNYWKNSLNQTQELL